HTHAATTQFAANDVMRKSLTRQKISARHVRHDTRLRPNCGHPSVTGAAPACHLQADHRRSGAAPLGFKGAGFDAGAVAPCSSKDAGFVLHAASTAHPPRVNAK